VSVVSVMTDGQAGKGDRYRPVDQKKYDEGWKKAFGKNKKNSKKGIMQPGGIYDMTDIPQPEDKDKDN